MALIIINVSVFGSIQVFAHDAMLDVDYDNCIHDASGDGIDETWYILNLASSCSHLSDEDLTIKYYFKESFSDEEYTWTTDVSESVAEEIKNAYANSMKKWNNVYFYSYDSDGTVTKHKIINIVEGTASDHNLLICPDGAVNNFAGTLPVMGSCSLIEPGTITHNHYSEWIMYVYVNHFYVNGSNSEEEVNAVRERTGAHEMGHILGIYDVDLDNMCNSTTSTKHHHELLMGYGSPLLSRNPNITYKDIAGVAITRGFHTDDDHQWLSRGLQIDGTYKLVCSICNGVKFVNDLSEYSYSIYNSCRRKHSLSDGNMMAVASYGNLDYYKCKYCRYVASFDSNVVQNYTKTYYDNTLHKCVNNVDGLEYTFYEEHNLNAYVYLDAYTHRFSCACVTGAQIETHTILASDIVEGIYYAPCMGCGYLLDLRDDYYNSIASISRVSINGSYILSGGIVVLVDEDVQAYLDGTLVFYHPDNIPTTQ